MTAGKKRITAIITCVAILFVTLCAGAFAITLEDELFRKNTPTFMKIGTAVKGSFESSKDYDIYMTEVQDNGLISLSFKHASQDEESDKVKIGWTVSLYKIIEGKERAYQEIATFTSFWSEKSSQWDGVGITKGTYCVVVKPGVQLNKTEYTLTSSFSKNTTYEEEPNDTKETATVVGVSYGKYGVSSKRENGTDTDFFKFILKEDSCVNLTFTHPESQYPQVGWTITLYNEKDEKITQYTSRLFDNMTQTGIIGLRAGTYYLSVEAQSEFCGTYTVLIGADKAINNEFELNDTMESAINLPENLQMSGSLADRMIGLDKDFYKINVPYDGYISVEFMHDTQDKDYDGWNIRVLKPMENGELYEIMKTVSKWNDYRCEIDNLGVSAGEYYICVDGDSLVYTSETYKLKWNSTPKANFEKEPNNTRISAERINTGETRYGVILSTDVLYDEDYYRFELTEDSSVCLEFGHEKAEGGNVCWVASIVDVDDFAMGEVNSALNQGLVSTPVIDLPAGVYYVKIETGMYGSELPYYFELVR